jgi:hypothetical protein
VHILVARGWCQTLEIIFLRHEVASLGASVPLEQLKDEAQVVRFLLPDGESCPRLVTYGPRTGRRSSLNVDHDRLRPAMIDLLTTVNGDRYPLAKTSEDSNRVRL